MNKEKLSRAIKDYFVSLVEKVAGKGNSWNVVDSNADIQKIIEEIEQKSWHVLPELPRENGFYYVTLQMESGKRGTEYCYYYKDKKKFFIIAEGRLENNQSWEEEVSNVIAWQEEIKPYMGSYPVIDYCNLIMQRFTKVE